jgi:integrase
MPACFSKPVRRGHTKNNSLWYKDLRKKLTNNYRKNGAIASFKYGKFFSNGRGIIRLFFIYTQTKKVFSLAAELLAIPWKDERVRIGNMVAMTTGCRLGKIQSFKKSDIDPVKPILYIRHSWSNAWTTKDRLKTPKNGEERKVPLLPEIRMELEKLLENNPYKDNPDPFIFCSSLPDQPFLTLGRVPAVCGLYDLEKIAQ